MSSEDKTLTRSGGVEVVADQGDDGSFEIRLERSSETAESTGPIAVNETTGAWRAEAAEPTAAPRRVSLPVLVLVLFGVIGLIVVVVTLTSAPRELSGSAPKTVPVSVEAPFRGYVVQGQEPARAVNLRLDVAEEEGEDAAFADADYEAPLADTAGSARSAQPVERANARDATRDVPTVRRFEASGPDEEYDPVRSVLSQPTREARLAEMERVLIERRDQLREERGYVEGGGDDVDDAILEEDDLVYDEEDLEELLDAYETYGESDAYHFYE